MDKKRDPKLDEYLDRLKRHCTECHFQKDLLDERIYEDVRINTQKIINKAVYDFAQKAKMSIYDVCLNYVPRIDVALDSAMNNPRYAPAIVVTVEMIRVPDDGFIKTTKFSNGTKENSEGRTAGGRPKEGQESN